MPALTDATEAIVTVFNCRDELETLPGGSCGLGPLEIGSKRAWLNATDPAGFSGIDGDVHVFNAHGCSEVVTVATGAPKNISLDVTCERRAKVQ